MLPRANRFSFTTGVPRKTYGTQFFAIRYEENDDKLKSAVVVGKKVDKRAVVRNKIKRQINHVIIEALSLEAKYKLIIYAKKPINGLTSKQIREELMNSFKTINIK